MLRKGVARAAALAEWAELVAVNALIYANGVVCVLDERIKLACVKHNGR